jgi:hypothetical protein
MLTADPVAAFGVERVWPETVMLVSRSTSPVVPFHVAIALLVLEAGPETPAVELHERTPAVVLFKTAPFTPAAAVGHVIA